MSNLSHRKLGIDLVFDSDLLYIAEDLLLSAMPGARHHAPLYRAREFSTGHLRRRSQSLDLMLMVSWAG